MLGQAAAELRHCLLGSVHEQHKPHKNNRVMSRWLDTSVLLVGANIPGNLIISQISSSLRLSAKWKVPNKGGWE